MCRAPTTRRRRIGTPASGLRSATRSYGRHWKVDLAADRPRVPIPRAAVKTYTNPIYPYARPAELDRPVRRRPVVIVGAGPVGLAAAIDYAHHGVPVVV